MNLAQKISDDIQELLRKWLKTYSDIRTHTSQYDGGYTNKEYNLSDTVSIMIFTFKRDEIAEINICVGEPDSTYNFDIQYDDYPVDLLGKESMEYFKELLLAPTNNDLRTPRENLFLSCHIRVENMEVVMKFLTLIYQHNPEIFHYQ